MKILFFPELYHVEFRLLLALAQVGLYPVEELHALFTSSAVVDEEGRVLKQIVFGNPAKLSKGGSKGRHLFKKNVFFWALPESPKTPPHDPNSGKLVLFFRTSKTTF